MSRRIAPLFATVVVCGNDIPVLIDQYRPDWNVVVVEGSSAVDTSMVTGESVPVEVGPGDEVIGATINANGSLVVRATRIGADTALAQIVRLVDEAQGSRAQVQRLADRVDELADGVDR